MKFSAHLFSGPKFYHSKFSCKADTIRQPPFYHSKFSCKADTICQPPICQNFVLYGSYSLVTFLLYSAVYKYDGYLANTATYNCNMEL